MFSVSGFVLLRDVTTGKLPTLMQYLKSVEKKKKKRRAMMM